MIVSVANALVRIFLNPTCASCAASLDRPLESPVCLPCWNGIARVTPPLCVRCGDAVAAASNESMCGRCRQRPPHFSIARSAGLYEGSLRQIIHAFKYGKRRALAGPLARMMTAAGVDVLRDADAVIPVPLDPWRALRRGFNQADDLAVHVGLPVWRVISRRLGTVPQAGLPASRRHANVRDAFAPALRHRLVVMVSGEAQRLQNRTVVLIDDVMTTGATLDACATVLVESGVRTVHALTIARAVAGPPVSRPEPHRPSIAPRQ